MQNIMNVSVIIPTYNRIEQTLVAIKSVSLQTHRAWELVIIDDGSTDNSFNALNEYCRNNIKNQYLIVKGPNLGVSHARNLGIKMSRFPWISFLDSDDEWLPHKLKTQTDYLSKNQNISWLHCEEKWMRNDIYQPRKKIHKKCGGDVFKQCIERCFIGPSTIMISRSLFDEIGLFNEDFPVCEDYELWLRISEKYSLGYIDEELIIKNGGHKDQLSTQFKAMDYWRVKALLPFIKFQSSNKYKAEIVAFIQRKSDILLNGFKKYGHKKQYDEILQAQQLIRLVNNEANI